MPVDAPPSANAARKSSIDTDESPPDVSAPVSSSDYSACDASTHASRFSSRGASP